MLGEAFADAPPSGGTPVRGVASSRSNVTRRATIDAGESRRASLRVPS